MIETPLTESEGSTILACLKGPQQWACVAPVLAGKDLQRLILVGLEPDPATGTGSLVISERILLPSSGVTASNQRSCSHCVDETLTRIAFDLTNELLQEAAAGTGKTRLRVQSTPPGAWITLDTTNVGLTDRVTPTFPGRHTVTVQRDGYQSETRTVEVIENQETILAFTLRPSAAPQSTPPANESTGHPYLVPAAVIGVGAAAVVAGVILQLPPDAGPGKGNQPKYLVNAPGAIAVVGGGVAVAVGVYLWLHATRTTSAAAMPTAAITEGGAVVGWTGRF
jgi:hypothetical protein